MTDPTVGALTQAFTIAAGSAPYVINVVDFVIPATATDPFPNTGVGRCCTCRITPNTFTDTAAWSTNLFQPAISLTKTGDLQVEVGTEADYVITLANNSSVDTPALTCTITDPTVGVNEMVTIASGASYVINVVDFVIPADAISPFVNTASASCSPAAVAERLHRVRDVERELIEPPSRADRGSSR